MPYLKSLGQVKDRQALPLVDISLESQERHLWVRSGATRWTNSNQLHPLPLKSASPDYLDTVTNNLSISLMLGRTQFLSPRADPPPSVLVPGQNTTSHKEESDSQRLTYAIPDRHHLNRHSRLPCSHRPRAPHWPQTRNCLITPHTE